MTGRPGWATKVLRPDPEAPIEYERPIATVTCTGGREEMVLLLVQREGGEPEFYVDGRSFSANEITLLIGGLELARGLVARELMDRAARGLAVG